MNPINFVINLRRRPDRLERFFKDCPLKNINTIYGFDGKNIENENINEIKLLDKFVTFKPGEKGCFISHLRLWYFIVENNIEYGLIFEDDAIFCENFLDKYKKILNELPKDADFIYIGGKYEPNYTMNENNFIPITDNVIKHKKITPEFYYDFCKTTHSYIISKNAARILIKSFESNPIISTALDHYMTQVLHNDDNNSIKIYESRPLLCHSPFISDSDIR